MEPNRAETFSDAYTGIPEVQESVLKVNWDL